MMGPVCKDIGIKKEKIVEDNKPHHLLCLLECVCRLNLEMTCNSVLSNVLSNVWLFSTVQVCYPMAKVVSVITCPHPPHVIHRHSKDNIRK